MLAIVKMAESLREKVSKTDISAVKNDNISNVECAVCLQSSVYPAELPCGHIFCYLCIKGIVNQGRRCAMCRQDIPLDYLDKPRLLNPVDIENCNKGFEDGHLWFYEGHNGWWQYEERTSLELESAYQKGERCCELLIAGFLYIVDFDAMLQYRRNDPSRRRRIKRDLATTSSKGIAGLKTTTKDNILLPSNTSDVVSNVLIPDVQNLNISGRPVQCQSNASEITLSNNLNSFNSIQNVQHSETNSRLNRSMSLILPQGSNNRACSSLEFQRENIGTLSSRTLEIRNVIHNTLDWTIEQIEALNLELSSDYENLIRNYGASLNNTDRYSILGCNRNNVSANTNVVNPSWSADTSISAIRSQPFSRSNLSEQNISLPYGSTTNEIIQSNAANERVLIRPPHLRSSDSMSQTLQRPRRTSKPGYKRSSSTQL